MAGAAERDGRARSFSLHGAELRPVSDDRDEAMLEWRPGAGWHSRLAADNPHAHLLELYLPMCSATAARPVTVGHLGQSLDGFIATHSGDSQFVTGGVTVSAFLAANRLDRLQIAIAPVLIGNGRPAIRLAPQARLRDCLRPGYKVFRMGGDVLFDCELDSQTNTEQAAGRPQAVTRVI